MSFFSIYFQALNFKTIFIQLHSDFKAAFLTLKQFSFSCISRYKRTDKRPVKRQTRNFKKLFSNKFQLEGQNYFKNLRRWPKNFLKAKDFPVCFRIQTCFWVHSWKASGHTHRLQWIYGPAAGHCQATPGVSHLGPAAEEQHQVATTVKTELPGSNLSTC